MPAKKRFSVLLEKDADSETTAITIPFNVKETWGTGGLVRVRGTINGFAFRSSVFPMGGGTHYMVINKDMRAGSGVRGGETITVTMERDDEPRTVEVPKDFAAALKKDKQAQAVWDNLSYTHRKEHVKAIIEAKKPETRVRRIEKSIAQLSEMKQKK
jgi:hypothetical protein